jgi:hypothetical protein
VSPDTSVEAGSLGDSTLSHPPVSGVQVIRERGYFERMCNSIPFQIGS